MKHKVNDAYIWQDMAGDTELEQMINAYITTQFIFSKNVCADAGLPFAKHIIEIVRAYGEDADPGAAWDALGRDKFLEKNKEGGANNE